MDTPPINAHSLRHMLATLACRVRAHTRATRGAEPGLGLRPRALSAKRSMDTGACGLGAERETVNGHRGLERP